MRAQVTLLGVSKMLDKCAKGRKMQGALHPRVTYACLEERHFEPFVVTTQPYEQLSHAALAWLKENQHECQVLQVCPPFPRCPSKSSAPLLVADLHVSIIHFVG